MAGDGGVGVRGGVELEVLLRVVVCGLGLRRGLGVVGHVGRLGVGPGSVRWV